MAVSTTNAVSGPYTANGVTTVFPFTFTVKTVGELSVVLMVNDGPTTIPTTDYAATVLPAGGSVEFSSPPTGGDIYIYSDPRFTQETNFSSGQRFSPDVVNDALDRAAIRDQYLLRELRALSDVVAAIHPGESGGLIDLPDWAIRRLDDALPGQTVWTLPFVATTPPVVWFDGVKLTGIDDDDGPADYVASGTTLTLERPAAGGETMEVAPTSLMLEPGFSHAANYTPGTVLRKLKQTLNPMDYPYAAWGNGISNDRAALFAADQDGPITITGNHRISSDLVLTKRLKREGNGRLTIDAGVTVTPLGGFDADARQLFYGAGSVAGLTDAWLEWWIGDYESAGSSPYTECRAIAQKAIDSMADSGTLRAGYGRWKFDGVTSLSFNNDVNFKGAEKNTTVFTWAGTSTNMMFVPASVSGRQTQLSGFRLEPFTEGTLPTAGTALDVRSSFCDVDDFVILDAYNGTNQEDVSGGSFSNFRVEGSLRWGRRIESSNDIFHSNFIIEGLRSYATFTSIVGTFVVGETVTFSGGTSGLITASYGGGKYRVLAVAVKPTVTNTILGGTSGATAVLSAFTVCHQTGGTRLEERLESFVDSNGEGGLGGEFGLIIERSVSGLRKGCSFNRSTDVYYDTNFSGSSITGSYLCTTTGGWFSSAGPDGPANLNLIDCVGDVYMGLQSVNGRGYGIALSGDCDQIEFISCKVIGNSVNDLTKADFIAADGAKNLKIIGGTYGQGYETGQQAPKSIVLVDGATHHGEGVKMIGVEVPAGSVVNGFAATDQLWLGVAGMPPRLRLADVTNAANEAAAYAAGVDGNGELWRIGTALQVMTL